MARITTTLGGLRCRIVEGDPPGKPELLVVLCHGYGAPGDDLVPFGTEVMALRPALSGRVRFLFPEAPVDLGPSGMPGGRAWWPIDMEELLTLQYDPQGGMERFRAQVPPELPQVRRMLMALIDEAERQAGLGTGALVLGGFSQGSMLATDVALRLEEAPAALCIFSGTAIAEAEWRRRAPARAGLQVLQTHGHEDPLLPFPGALALRDLLQGAGAKVEFIPFHGGHTIPLEGLERFAALLESKLGANTGPG